MTKEEIYQYFYTNSANLGINSILFCLLAGLFIAAIICITYAICYRGVTYNRKFNFSLMIIELVAIVIMLMISSNVVISLGMVGALSIIRFRTAIKDSRDTVFIFWTIAEGLSVGSQNFKLAFVTTLFIAVVMIITTLLPERGHRYLLVITGRENTIDQKELKEVLKPIVKSSKLRTANIDDDHQEYIYEVKTKKELDPTVANQIKTVYGVRSVNWVVESGEMVG